MQEFKTARELASHIRDKMDDYAGRELPLEFKEAIREIMNSNKYRNMIYKGEDFSRTFVVIMRDFRIERLNKVLDELGL